MWGLERQPNGQWHLLLFQSGPSWASNTHVICLTTSYKSCLRVSDTCFWPLWPPVYMCTCPPHTHIMHACMNKWKVKINLLKKENDLILFPCSFSPFVCPSFSNLTAWLGQWKYGNWLCVSLFSYFVGHSLNFFSNPVLILTISLLSYYYDIPSFLQASPFLRIQFNLVMQSFPCIIRQLWPVLAHVLVLGRPQWNALVILYSLSLVSSFSLYTLLLLLKHFILCFSSSLLYVRSLLPVEVTESAVDRGRACQLWAAVYVGSAKWSLEQPILVFHVFNEIQAQVFYIMWDILK